MADLDQPRVRWRTRASPRRHDRRGEPQFRRLLEPRVGARHGAPSPARPVSPNPRSRRQRPGERGGGQRSGDRQVGRRLADPQPAATLRNTSQVPNAMRSALRDRQDHRQGAPSQPTTARLGAANEVGTISASISTSAGRVLDAGQHRRSRDPRARARREQRRRVHHLVQPTVGHREDADLVGRTKRSSPSAGCGTGGRVRLRSTAPYRPCVRAPSAPRSCRPW